MPSRRSPIVLLPIAALAASLAPLAAGEPSPEEIAKLITIRPGNIPIIVSAPHGGGEAIPEAAERKNKQLPKFVTARDSNTYELATKLANDMELRLGGQPYLVLAKFARKFADANRPAAHSFESDVAKPYYDAYHAALAKYCREIQQKWRGGLLMDVHGQAAYPDSLVRGTNDGETVDLLLKRQTREAFTGPKSIWGQMESRGYQILPECKSTEKEIPSYNGGYIVETYGSHRPEGIDAMQFEFGNLLRTPKAKRDKTASDLADSIQVFCQEFLPTAVLKPAAKK